MRQLFSGLLTLNPIAFRIGSWPVYWYGLIIGFGMLIAYFLYIHEVKRKSMDPEAAFDRLFWAIIIGFIGARLYYVAFSWSNYQDDLLSIFAIWQGGIAIYGGIIAGFLALLYFVKKEDLDLTLQLDIAAPALMAAQMIGRWGNFVNQEAFGQTVDRTHLEALKLPDWIINHLLIDGAYRQPTFLYESTWNAVGLTALLILRRYKGLLKEGEIALFYLIWYGCGRAWIEGLRTDSLYWGSFRVSQILSILIVAFCSIVVIYRRQNTNLPAYTASDQLS